MKTSLIEVPAVARRGHLRHRHDCQDACRVRTVRAQGL